MSTHSFSCKTILSQYLARLFQLYLSINATIKEVEE